MINSDFKVASPTLLMGWWCMRELPVEIVFGSYIIKILASNFDILVV